VGDPPAAEVRVVPPCFDGTVQSSSLLFAEAVRALGLEARALGLTMPGFRSPPRLRGVQRTIRRWPSGQATVAVTVRGRPWPAVLSDLVEGVITANGLEGSPADQARAHLWRAVAPEGAGAAA
jgi:hypothetical protein